jgi:hypothetical protein
MSVHTEALSLVELNDQQLDVLFDRNLDAFERALFWRSSPFAVQHLMTWKPLSSTMEC